MAALDEVGNARKALLTLQAQRDALEAEADAIASELGSPGPGGEPPVGVKGSLVDKDGFPLPGHDLMNIRRKRHRLACIQTDHKALMKRIEGALHELHQAMAAPGHEPARPSPSSVTASTPAQAGPSASVPAQAPEQRSDAPMVPIAKVDEVSSGSPSEEAGLSVGDLIVSFGGVDISHPQGLGGVVGVVRENVGKPVPVRVLRGASGHHASSGTVQELSLVPRTWEGRGLLGCHLLPP